ncbi:Serine/arginine repetitive matrix protein 1 [Camellia lanceoleosa]|uniref:Serine/arginine repetitive matrix protein 1 n=1 Tax=Camellia lanceoleosa TaxID=1840588 RepID=A0ACC0F1D6_9ERIC|nr:Serine/arginine repetitive matrix protein 1 [Camellia lanceoleosa]
MSGGFFRGTSADQDTRFSNKQAKLLKSQKFAPELDHLVDMSKVKMDVVKPWIANRVTELLGFEDEVLINFIYGLLDGKEVNGKQVQISLTGFMEKNTGKFMKELWMLLLSAEKNASGVPQQFLDAKEEETRKKKAESDRIASEIQKKKEKEKESRELEQEKIRKMDSEADISRANNADLEPSSKHQLRASGAHSADEKETSERNGSRGRGSERGKPRNISESPPQPRGRSISSERVYHSPPRRSVTPRRRYSPQRSISPSRRRLSHSRRRSTSRSRRRSPSPVRRRLRSPLRHRSRSPIRRGQDHLYVRGPGLHLHPTRSPIYRRRRSPTPSRHRSPSPEERISVSPVRRLPPSPGRRKSPKRQRSPVQSPRERVRTLEKFSPVRHPRFRENVENSADIRKGPDSMVRRPPISLRSPQRDPRDRDNSRKKASSSSPLPHRSQSLSESPPGSRRRSPSEDRRSYSPYQRPVKQPKEQKVRDISASPPRKPRNQNPRHESPESSREKEETNYARNNGDPKLKSSEKKSSHSSTADERKDSLERVHYKVDHSSERVGGRRSSEIRSHHDGLELRMKDQEIRSEKTSRRVLHPEVSDQQQLPPPVNKDSSLSVAKNNSRSNEVKGSKRLHETETALKSTRKVDEKDRSGSLSSGSQESDKHGPEVHEKRKHKRSKRKEVTSDESYDSEIEDRKDAKRRRKEEKRSRKEERRRRRDERRRKREERRAEKLKAKSIDTVTPSSDFVKNQDGNASDGERIVRMESGASDAEETESEKKKLEIELRKKALESLRAKKGAGH